MPDTTIKKVEADDSPKGAGTSHGSPRLRFRVCPSKSSWALPEISSACEFVPPDADAYGLRKIIEPIGSHIPIHYLPRCGAGCALRSCQ
jgi:hypothetical protein